MSSARITGGPRGYRLPCGEPLTSRLGLPDEPPFGSCSGRGGSGRRGEFIRPVNASPTAKGVPRSAGADGMMATLRFAHPTAALLIWPLKQYFRMLDDWYSPSSHWRSLGPCSVSARGDIPEHPAERHR